VIIKQSAVEPHEDPVMKKKDVCKGDKFYSQQKCRKGGGDSTRQAW